jgi:hypothetical protein
MKRALQLVISLGLSVFFVWLSLRGAALGEVVQAVASASPALLLVYALVWSAIHVVRIQRWALLLQPLAQVRFRQLNPLGSVGFMALMILPLRLGEFARPVLASERLGIRKSAAFASVVVERVVDGLVVGLLLVGLLWSLPDAVEGRAAPVRIGSVLVTLAFGGGLLVLVLAYRSRAAATRLIHRLLDQVSPRVAMRVADMLEAFFGGLDVVPSARKLAEFFALTAVYWGLCALGIGLLAPAFGLQLDARQSFTVLGLQVIGAMIPAGPGMIGTLQYFTVLGLDLFIGGRQPVAVAAFAHTLWAMQFVHQVGLGLYFVAAGQVSLGSLYARLGRDEPTSPSPQSP